MKGFCILNFLNFVLNIYLVEENNLLETLNFFREKVFASSPVFQPNDIISTEYDFFIVSFRVVEFDDF